MFDGKKYMYDGNIVDSNGLPTPFENRGFLYADGFFESIRVIDGTIPLFKLHHGRILDSLETYKMEAPEWLNAEQLENLLIELHKSRVIKGDSRIRLTIYRSGAGKFTPESNIATGFASIEDIDNEGYTLNEKGLAIGLYQELSKTPSRYAHFKNLHSQLYIQAGIYAKEQGLDDVIILNDENNLIETINSNIFLVVGGALYTPSLEYGAVGGVMRATVMNMALEMGVKIFESKLAPQDLVKADEVFLTNAVKGIQWVASYRTKRYFNKTSSLLTEHLRSLTNPRV